MSSYSYLPLPQSGHDIRILVLLPGVFESQLQFNLIVRSNEEYEALSYCWGSGESTSSMIVVSLDSDLCTLPVWPNLESALRHLRHTDRPRTLWVDAICINQLNTDEKNVQVPMMAEIYSNASNVCIWLGDQIYGFNDSVREAIEFIPRVLDLSQFDNLAKSGNSLLQFQSFAAMLRSSWFTRRWVIQELALAKKATIYCGIHSVNWLDFASAVSILQFSNADFSNVLTSQGLGSLDNSMPLGAGRLAFLTNDIVRKGPRGEVLETLVSLEYLVSSLTQFESSDPRDIIYSVLALSKDTRRGAMVNSPFQTSGGKSGSEGSTEYYRVDYSQSYFEVCNDFVRHAIKCSNSLDILCRSWAVPAPEGETLPSWIKILCGNPFSSLGQHKRTSANSLVGLPSPGFGRTYNASYQTRLTLHQNLVNDQSLTVDGWILDDIQETQDAAKDGSIPNTWVKFGKWNNTAAPPPDPFWRTLVAGRGSDGLNPPPHYPVACQYLFNQEQQAGYLDSLEIVAGSSVAQEFLKRVQSVVWNRRLVRTRLLSALGLAPEATKEGDLICILFGCSVPVILRRLPKQITSCQYFEDCFTFIGECYVHGMMDGEAQQQRTQSEELWPDDVQMIGGTPFRLV